MNQNDLKTLQRARQSALQKMKNVNKHIRIAKATTGRLHIKHAQKANALIEKYGIKR